MWYNERLQAQEWFYALPEGADLNECGGFKGLFVAVSFRK